MLFNPVSELAALRTLSGSIWKISELGRKALEKDHYDL